jgi:hypothetical protein
MARRATGIKMRLGVLMLVLFMAIRPAPAASPWREADGKDRIFIALKGVTCGDVHYTVWIPYDLTLKKTLDFYRIVADGNHAGGKITMRGADVFLDDKRCMEDNPDTH